VNTAAITSNIYTQKQTNSKIKENKLLKGQKEEVSFDLRTTNS